MRQDLPLFIQRHKNDCYIPDNKIMSVKIHTKDLFSNEQNAYIEVHGFTSVTQNKDIIDVISNETTNIAFYVQVSEFKRHFQIYLQYLTGNEEVEFSRVLSALYLLNLIKRFRIFIKNHIENTDTINNEQAFNLVYEMFCYKHNIQDISFNNEPMFDNIESLDLLERLEREKVSGFRCVYVTVGDHIFQVNNITAGIGYEMAHAIFDCVPIQ